MSKPEFDSYRTPAYREAVSHATAFAGAEHDFYVEAKFEHLLEICARNVRDAGTLAILDAGSGVGLMDRFLTRSFRSVAGCDVSAVAIEDARNANPGVDYRLVQEGTFPFGDNSFDVTVASCVLHHVPLDERDWFVAEMRRVTRPGGMAVLFEHNPLNPLTRLVVSRCAFDEDAVLLWPSEVGRLLGRAEMRILEMRYLIFFPWAAPALRLLERNVLRNLPLGAQYCSVGTVPDKS